MNSFVVDTHTLVWFLGGDGRLGKQAGSVLRDPDARLIIPAIVLAEVKYLGQRGRSAQNFDDVLQALEADSRCVIYPIDLEVVRKAPPELDIHDSLIVGAALAQSPAVAGVLTRDEAITSSGLVPVIW